MGGWVELPSCADCGREFRERDRRHVIGGYSGTNRRVVCGRCFIAPRISPDVGEMPTIPLYSQPVLEHPKQWWDGERVRISEDTLDDMFNELERCGARYFRIYDGRKVRRRSDGWYAACILNEGPNTRAFECVASTRKAAVQALLTAVKMHGGNDG